MPGSPPHISAAWVVVEVMTPTERLPDTTDLIRFTGTWKLDPQKTTIAFRTRALWIFAIKGTAKALSGIATVGPDGRVHGTLVLDAASFDTKNNTRDKHLRTGDLLDATTHPTMIFEATSARTDGVGRLEIYGTLTVRGQSRPLTLQAEISGFPHSATVSTSIEIDRSLWGITWGAKMGAALKNQVTIVAHFDQG
jgi:polyisoprenoid-binding protein YceI